MQQLESSYTAPHVAITQALRGHGRFDPFTLEWLRTRCRLIDPFMSFDEIHMAELRKQIIPSTATTPGGGKMFTLKRSDEKA